MFYSEEFPLGINSLLNCRNVAEKKTQFVKPIFGILSLFLTLKYRIYLLFSNITARLTPNPDSCSFKNIFWIWTLLPSLSLSHNPKSCHLLTYFLTGLSSFSLEFYSVMYIAINVTLLNVNLNRSFLWSKSPNGFTLKFKDGLQGSVCSGHCLPF